MSKARNWCITINNWDREEYESLKVWCVQGTQVSYAVLGKETGDDEKTPHLQGYLELKGARTLNWLKRQPGLSRCHAEPRKGTGPEASSYCKKDDDWWETGQLKHPNKRTDLLEVQQHLDEGKSAAWIAKHYFTTWVQYGRRFREYIALQRNTLRRRKSWVNVIYGLTGVGKTRFVHQQHPDEDIWKYPGSGWFDGYWGQPIALFDDFRGDLDISLLLRVLDRYSMDVPVKGGFVNWNPKRIYITSNIVPEMWYESIDADTLPALLRRLDRIDYVRENLFEN